MANFGVYDDCPWCNGSGYHYNNATRSGIQSILEEHDQKGGYPEDFISQARKDMLAGCPTCEHRDKVGHDNPIPDCPDCKGLGSVDMTMDDLTNLFNTPGSNIYLTYKRCPTCDVIKNDDHATYEDWNDHQQQLMGDDSDKFGKGLDAGDDHFDMNEFVEPSLPWGVYDDCPRCLGKGYFERYKGIVKEDCYLCSHRDAIGNKFAHPNCPECKGWGSHPTDSWKHFINQFNPAFKGHLPNMDSDWQRCEHCDLMREHGVTHSDELEHE